MKPVSKKLRRKFAVIRDLLAVLGYDSVFCRSRFEEEWQKPGTSEEDIAQLNFWLKAAVRSFFAQVEGLTYAMRLFVVEAAEEGHIQLDKKIHAALQERKYDKTTGKLGQAYRGRFDDNFKNAFRYFPRVFESDWAPNFQGAGWDSFKKLLDARDDFTHPKEVTHLFQAAPGEHVHSAMAWYTNTFYEMLRDVGRRLGREIDLNDVSGQTPPDRTKLSLIQAPKLADNASMLQQEIQFMSLLKSDTALAFRVFKEGVPTNSDLLIGEWSQSGARLFTRALFTEIEAIGHMASRLLNHSASREEIIFSEEESELLGTKELTLKIANIAEIFSRKFGYGKFIDKTGSSWKSFSEVASFRDRITHPKDSSDLQINVDSDGLKVIVGAMEWYCQILDAIELSEGYATLTTKR